MAAIAARRARLPPANEPPTTPARIAIRTMNVTEKCAPSRNQSLKLMPPHALRMTATQNTGSEKNTKVMNVVR